MLCKRRLVSFSLHVQAVKAKSGSWDPVPGEIRIFDRKAMCILGGQCCAVLCNCIYIYYILLLEWQKATATTKGSMALCYELEEI